MRILVQPYGAITLGAFLKDILSGKYGEFKVFQSCVAFAKRSGVRHIQGEVKQFLENDGNQVRIVVGIDHSGTSVEGLEDLLDCCTKGDVWINHCEDKFVTFHPKIYLFENDEKAILIIGSQNLTEGGLYTNDESSAVYWLNIGNKADDELLTEIKSYFDIWCDPKSENSKLLDSSFLKLLTQNGNILPEVFLTNGKQRSSKSELSQDAIQKEALFSKSLIKRSAPRISVSKATKAKELKLEIPASDLSSTGFVMTLQKTDVGTGQTTKGTSRRSPEIFIPLSARDFAPDFWGWKENFTEDEKRLGKFDRLGVKMRIGGETATVNMMTWPVKHDFRLRSEVLRSSGNIGDILRIERVDGSDEFSYYVEIIPKGTTSYDQYLTLCSNSTRNSKKTWGYYN